MTKSVSEIEWPFKQIIRCDMCANLYKLEIGDVRLSNASWEDHDDGFVGPNCWRYSNRSETQFQSCCPCCGEVNEMELPITMTQLRFQDYE